MSGHRVTEDLTDATFLPSNPADGFLVDRSFGALFATSNGIASGVKQSELVNNFTGNPRITLDASNLNRIWAVDHDAGGVGCGGLCLGYSIDGGVTYTHATFPDDTQPSVGLFDIAEDAYDAEHAAVGGEGGALVVTAAANQIPGSAAKPPGPPSALSPLTVTTGGATIVIFRIVIVTGRSDHYVPVELSVAHSRTFTVTILKANRSVSTAHVTLRRGHRKLRLRLARAIKPSRYTIVITVHTLKGRRAGRKLRYTFGLT